MSDSAPPRFIWVALYRRNAAGVRELAGEFKLERFADEDVAEFRDRVKDKVKNLLAYCDALQLEVWTGDDIGNTTTQLDARDFVPLCDVLIVIAPPPPAPSAANGASLESESVRACGLASVRAL
jgi:hypothetical protein